MTTFVAYPDLAFNNLVIINQIFFRLLADGNDPVSMFAGIGYFAPVNGSVNTVVIFGITDKDEIMDGNQLAARELFNTCRQLVAEAVKYIQLQLVAYVGKGVCSP